MNVEVGEEASEEKFKARRGWFLKVKERSYLHNIKVQGEATVLMLKLQEVIQRI